MQGSIQQTDERSPARRSLLPILDWLPRYRWGRIGPDLLAAVTVAAFTVPESMAYASLAGLPPEAGLYASFVAPIVYALFGTSRQLAVGPTSALAILVASGVGAVAGGDVARYASLAALLAGLTGLVAAVAYLLKLGLLVNFISESVLVGFSAGAGLYIASTQLGKLFGIEGASGEFFERILGVLARLGETHLLSLLLGVGALVVLLGERYAHRLPWSLLVVAGSIVLVSLMNLDALGVAITGAIPRGLPLPAVPSFGPDDVVALLPSALAVFLLAYVEGMGMVRTLAGRHRYPVDANQELLALGAANVACGLFQSFPVGGSLSRSAVADEAGARTPLAGLLAGLLVGAVALFLTGFFTYLPEPVLAAVVLVAVRGLLNLPALRRLWQVSRVEFWIASAALAGVLLFGMLQGVLLGVVISLLMLLRRAGHPHTAVLGRVPGSAVYSDIARHPLNEQSPDVLVYRVDAGLFYANAAVVRADLLARLAEQRQRLVVLDMSATPSIDLPAADALGELVSELAADGVALRLANTHGGVHDLLQRAGLGAHVGALDDQDTIDVTIAHWRQQQLTKAR